MDLFSSMVGLSVKRNTPEKQQSDVKYLRYLKSKLDAEQGTPRWPRESRRGDMFDYTPKSR